MLNANWFELENFSLCVREIMTFLQTKKLTNSKQWFKV